MHVVHLTASTFFGGPERQMLGLAEYLPGHYRSTYLSFSENGRCNEFVGKVRERGINSEPLTVDTPRYRQVLDELTERLIDTRADILLTHTYKPNILGRIAARRARIPCVVVSRGWTWENLKVRAFEMMDRVNLRYVDHVVAVSEGQGQRVRKAGVPSTRMSIIRNAARLKAFAKSDPVDRDKLMQLFPVTTNIIMAAGRLSTEKGFAVLVEAAAIVLKQQPNAGFVLFGEGVERPALESRIRELGIGDRFRMPGFNNELDRMIPWADLFVLPSFTEGLPNVALEAGAAGVPVVATAVGGTPEVVVDGKTGYLVPSGNPEALAERMLKLLSDQQLRTTMGNAARAWMNQSFTFEAQAKQYVQLFERLTSRAKRRAA